MEARTEILPASSYSYSLAAAAQAMALALLLLPPLQAKFGELLAKVSAAEALVILDEIECLCNPWFTESRVSFQLAEDKSLGAGAL